MESTAIRNTKNNLAFRDALATGEVWTLLSRYHSADVAEYYGISQATVQRKCRGYSDLGKPRVAVEAMAREAAIRNFVNCSLWTTSNREAAGL